MIINLLSYITTEPVTLTEAKTFLGLIGNQAHDHDNLITDLITAARERAEEFTGRSFISKEYQLIADATKKIRLPHAPIKAITGISYKYDGVWVDIGEDDIPQFHELNNDVLGIDLSDHAHLKIKITYTTGYGDVGTKKNPFPLNAKIAMLMIIRTMYDNRDDIVKGTIVAKLPTGSEALLAPYRTFRFQ